MAHDDDCHTCAQLADNQAEVRIEEPADPCARRFVGHPWPVAEALRFATAAEAAAHPLANALWRAGTVEILLDPDGATVVRDDPRAWPFYAESLALTLRERLALTG